jgi:hypothetical protein
MRNRLGKRECCAALGRDGRLTGSLRSPDAVSIKAPCPAGNRVRPFRDTQRREPLTGRIPIVGKSIAANGRNDHDPTRRDDYCGDAEYQPACAQYNDQHASQDRALPQRRKIQFVKAGIKPTIAAP